ncbi:rRNA maturation RNase YbeY [Candidatus Cerribacteria bacterium 'Amazon FNV 2010 28 9']|uniref:rRNA maturation RNase YbeY n=1 Tax=Candidatus Cerribacteria bacterium 'Amazon FNV 2010 28 9' TaxID=2081795 RepID=A0A317JQI6_9BACT|nr:MAG: rRNA maturation RNase YbeY [Candidatus Cerribacteria bacterium 'Amazon FNV 2010 28 9']
MTTVFLTAGSRYPVDRKKIRSFVQEFLHSHGVDDAVINISIVGERKITELNEKYLHHEGVTDVLSFPQYEKGSDVDYESTLDPIPQKNDEQPFVNASDSPRHLGDVVVCFPEVVRQAMKRGKMVDDHICFLIEHSLQHLLGIHHE